MSWYRFVVSHPEASNSAPALRSMIEKPAWRERVGEANAAALQIAIERVYTEPPHFTQWARVDLPLTSWLYEAILAFLDGAEAQSVMVNAQSKADSYTNCITPSLGLSDQALGEAVVTCARKADPGRW